MISQTLGKTQHSLQSTVSLFHLVWERTIELFKDSARFIISHFVQINVNVMFRLAPLTFLRFDMIYFIGCQVPQVIGQSISNDA